jgi:hypothetical protein
VGDENRYGFVLQIFAIQPTPQAANDQLETSADNYGLVALLSRPNALIGDRWHYEAVKALPVRLCPWTLLPTLKALSPVNIRPSMTSQIAADQTTINIYLS